MVESAPGKNFLAVPLLTEVPHLVHGFAALGWKARDFQQNLLQGMRPISLNQVHSNIVHVVEDVPVKRMRGDALLTALPRLLLTIKTADCLPVIIVEEEAGVVGAVHCGWKGTAGRVIQHAVRTAKEHFQASPASLLIALGPCIGPECYEVGKDVKEAFEREGLSTSSFKSHVRKKGRYLLDLRAANLDQLIEAGVKRERVSSVDFCSHCRDEYPSWRRDRDRVNRMLSFVGWSSPT